MDTAQNLGSTDIEADYMEQLMDEIDRLEKEVLAGPPTKMVTPSAAEEEASDEISALEDFHADSDHHSCMEDTLGAHGHQDNHNEGVLAAVDPNVPPPDPSLVSHNRADEGIEFVLMDRVCFRLPPEVHSKQINVSVEDHLLRVRFMDGTEIKVPIHE